MGKVHGSLDPEEESMKKEIEQLEKELAEEKKDKKD